MAGPAVEKLHQAEAYKEEGNRLYKDGAYKRALGAYHKVFCYVNGLQVPGNERNDNLDPVPADGSVNRNRLPKENVEDLRKLKQSTRLNMAACYLKLGENQKCVDACTVALTFGESSKAHFRRAQAHAELRNLSGAKADLERAQELAPDDRTIQLEMRKIRAEFLKADDKEKKRCAKMFPSTPKDQEEVQAGGGEGGHAHGEHGHGHGHTQGDNGHGHADCQGHDHGSCDGHSHGPEAHSHGHGHGHGHAASSSASTAEPSSAPPPKKAPPAVTPGTVVQPMSLDGSDDARKLEVPVRELTYSWEQSEDDVKIYVYFDQSEELSNGVDESRVKVEFGEWNFLLVIESLEEGKAPLGLRLGDFHRRLAPDKCTCTVRSSRITLKLVKQAKERWWNLLQRAPLHAD